MKRAFTVMALAALLFAGAGLAGCASGMKGGDCTFCAKTGMMCTMCKPGAPCEKCMECAKCPSCTADKACDACMECMKRMAK